MTYDGAESAFDELLSQPEQLRSVAEQVCDLAAECMRRQGYPDEECEIVSRAGAILADSLQARLTESRIGRKDGRRLLVPAGTVVDITGIDPAGRMTAAYHGTWLTVSQDQATPIYDEEVSPMRITIVEAGDSYALRIADIDAELTGDTTQELVEQAKAEVAKRGYRVMPDEEGGCCEYCQEIDAYGNVQASIAITVYPEPARE